VGLERRRSRGGEEAYHVIRDSLVGMDGPHLGASGLAVAPKISVYWIFIFLVPRIMRRFPSSTEDCCYLLRSSVFFMLLASKVTR